MNLGKLAPSDLRYEAIKPVLSVIMQTSIELGVNTIWSEGGGWRHPGLLLHRSMLDFGMIFLIGIHGWPNGKPLKIELFASFALFVLCAVLLSVVVSCRGAWDVSCRAWDATDESLVLRSWFCVVFSSLEGSILERPYSGATPKLILCLCDTNTKCGLCFCCTNFSSPKLVLCIRTNLTRDSENRSRLSLCLHNDTQPPRSTTGPHALL